MKKAKADYLFEVSWEVCNKVGGIYTVVKSKAARMMEYYDNYFLIGPYFENNAKMDFTPLPVPDEFKVAFDSLQKEGVICHFGRWFDEKASPFAILIDFKNISYKKNDFKKIYWDDYKIDSLRGYWDFEEPMLWAYYVGRLIELMKNNLLKNKKIIAHFHEWLSGFGLLYLKKNCPAIATVFTTHATTLGRTLAGNGRNLYSELNWINPLTEAYNYIIEAKHLTEKASAQAADIFTTVSEITAMEAEKFLGRKAEILVLNGLDIEKFPTIEETSIKHVASRDKIREFLTYYFFPYYSVDFDIDQSLNFYIVGRYEYRNKGFDILIQALGKLNKRLKEERNKEIEERNKEIEEIKMYSNQNEGGLLKQHTLSKNSELVERTIAVFFWTPMDHSGFNFQVLENKNFYQQIKNQITLNSDEIIKKIIYGFISNKDNSKENLIHEKSDESVLSENLFSKSFLNNIKKNAQMFERTGNPPISTHILKNENNNQLVMGLKQNELLNRQEDPVKIIIEPVYLDGNDGFINLSYYDAMIGCHLGLFPSYYEPWGYTPLETAALGVPALTTDLSGFGMFLKKENKANSGIYVLDRLNKDEHEVIENFTNILYDFAKMTHNERVDLKLHAKKVSELADWGVLIENYLDAHNQAIEKSIKRIQENK